MAGTRVAVMMTSSRSVASSAEAGRAKRAADAAEHRIRERLMGRCSVKSPRAARAAAFKATNPPVARQDGAGSGRFDGLSPRASV